MARTICHGGNGVLASSTSWAKAFTPFAAALAIVGPAAGQTAASPVDAQAPAVSMIGQPVSLSPRLVELTLRAPAVGGNGQTKVRVLLPEGYDANGSARYPVIYLYHGGGGNQADWTTPDGKGKAEEITAGLPVIVVMPDGGLIGFHADWYNGGKFGPPQWETYHVAQLIPFIDKTFRTIPQRWARATAGLSMGGGGLRYAARHPDLIGLTASFSGALDMADPEQATIGLVSKFPQFVDVFGPFLTQEVRHRGTSATDLAGNLSNTDIFLSSGDTGMPESTMVIRSWKATKARLDHFAIPYAAAFYPGQGHTWPNWNRAFGEWLPRAMARFNDPAWRNAQPRAFSYTSIATNYQEYGWAVTFKRRAIEFSTLDVDGPAEFEITGSGQATVQTAPIAPAGTGFRVTLTSSGNPHLNRVTTIKTDAAGRLTIPVALGAPNPFQQYSPQADAASTGPSPDTANFTLRGNGSRFYRAMVRISPMPAGPSTKRQ